MNQKAPITAGTVTGTLSKNSFLSRSSAARPDFRQLAGERAAAYTGALGARFNPLKHLAADGDAHAPGN